MLNRVEMVAAHRELVEASDGVRHLLVVEDLTAEKIKTARNRLALAYERVIAVDDEMVCV
ncbi:MAG: hypothetical protein ABIP21_00130 [Acidimicrobiia bacterium]